MESIKVLTLDVERSCKIMYSFLGTFFSPFSIIGSLESDGLYYWEPQKKLAFDDAESACRRFGYRLAMAKTKTQHDILMKIYSKGNGKYRVTMRWY